MPAAHQSPLNDVLDRLRQWEADEAAANVTPPPPSISPISKTAVELKPPNYGAATEQAIASIVDSVSTEFARKLRDVRSALDRIEQQSLQSAAHAKGTLNEHITVCVRLNDEIERMTSVVAEIAEITAATK